MKWTYLVLTYKIIWITALRKGSTGEIKKTFIILELEFERLFGSGNTLYFIFTTIKTKI